MRRQRWIVIVILVLLAAGVSAALAGVTYHYDRLHRLVEAEYDNGVRVFYEYDAVGNRTALTCYRPGDINGDGSFDVGDVSAFVKVLLGIDTDPIRVFLSDFDTSGTIDGNDIQPFVTALLNQ